MRYLYLQNPDGLAGFQSRIQIENFGPEADSDAINREVAARICVDLEPESLVSKIKQRVAFLAYWRKLEIA